MTIKGQKGWVKIGETLYPITDMDINFIATVPLNTTVTIDPPMPSVLVKRASTPEMSDDDAFDLMDSIRKERPWQR